MADFGVIIEKLHSFETADAIADYFREYGIKAVPQEARSCAITQFVKAEIDQDYIVSTSTRDVTLYELKTHEDENGWGERTYEDEIQCVNHTEAMQQFVYNFDKGRYMFLVEEGAEFNPNFDEDPDCGCPSCSGPDYDY